MQVLNIPIEEFLRPFFDVGENVCIRAFSDKKGDEFKGQKFDINMGKFAQFLPVLKEHNSRSRGIFFVVNYGGHEDKDITRINAQFVENDNLSIEEQYKRLMQFPLEPSLIVKTKKSLHSYWLIKNGEVSKFREVQGKLAKYFNGDKTIINESRVLRLPGFNHCKGDPVMVECIKFNPELRYTQEELLKCLPQEELSQVAGPKVLGTQAGLGLVTRRCEFIKYCNENADKLSEYDWYAMITNLAVFEGGSELIHKLSEPYKGYSKVETEDKIQHFLRSGTKPIKCATLAERGYRCPNLDTGGCSCKAPAAYAYEPLGLDDLVEVLSEQVITRKPAQDAILAANFIKEYLSNVDEIIAEAFISCDLKKHFELRNDFVRTLIKKYREAHTKFIENKVKREKEAPDVATWYEPTERGMRFIPGILATYMSENVNAIYSAEDYFLYENGVYRDVKELVAAKIVREHLMDRYATMSGINDALSQWQMLIYRPINQINSNPFIINVKNGLYNVFEDKLKEHTPEYFSTVQINANYNSEAQCPLFMKFLDEVLDYEEIRIIQEILGYLLIPINKAQKSFVFVGAGNAGKSTLLSVAQEILLGSSNVSNVAWQALADRFKTAELFGKLANIFADLPSKSIDDNGIFKSITGEDYITVEKKNKTPFSFKPYARLLFSCNEIPRNYGDKSNAFYRRLVIIRFERPVPMSKRDANLKEKLFLEADGIFMWALQGLKRLIQNNYQFSESEKTRLELEKYRTESNSVLSFMQDCCEIGDDKYVESKELYRMYKEYCNEAGLTPVSNIRFNKELLEDNPSICKNKDSVSRRVIMKGLCLQ